MMKMRFAYDGAAACSSPRTMFGYKLGALVLQAIATSWQWSHRRRERRTLLRLDDHMLRDIGIDRSHAEQMAARSFWRA
ncbi:MAG: DUF1127 domain-containing protein [Dongiaceae bacterium]